MIQLPPDAHIADNKSAMQVSFSYHNHTMLNRVVVISGLSDACLWFVDAREN